MEHSEKIAIVGKAALFPDGKFGSQFSSQQNGNEITVPVTRKLKRYMSASIPSAIKVSEYAFHAAGINPLDREKNIGIYAGQYGYLHPHLEEFIPAFIETHPDSMQTAFKDAWESSKVNPFIVTNMLNNNLLGLLSLHWGIAGDCAALVRDSLSAVAAIQEAMFSLQQQFCDVALVICAGADSDLFLDDLINTKAQEIRLKAPEIGAVAFVLKLLKHAEKDADPIEGVIEKVFSEYDFDTMMKKICADKINNSDYHQVIYDFPMQDDFSSFESFQQTENAVEFENLSDIEGDRGCPGLMSVLFAALTKQTTSQTSFLAISGSKNQHYSAINIQGCM